MTINQFLRNPSGKGSAAGARRDVIIDNLTSRYFKLMKSARNLFKMTVFKEDNNYFFVFKIPSETYTKEKLTYDVVIQLLPIGKAGLDLTLNRYAVKVFSNAPNFLFTYAYVYNQDDIVIDFLKDKISKEALTKEPEIRNPNQEYGFEKSIYFALLYIVNEKHTTKALLKSSNINKNYVHDNISSCDEKLEEYNKFKNKEKLEKEKKEKKEAKDRAKKGIPPKNFKSVYRKRHYIHRNKFDPKTLQKFSTTNHVKTSNKKKK